MSAQGEAEWQQFLGEPAGYAMPSQLGLAFDGELSDETCGKLQQIERLRSRLSEMLLPHLPVLAKNEIVTPSDRRIALLDRASLDATALRAGGIACANALSNTIAGPRAVAIREALGGETISVALANRELADPNADLAAVSDIRGYVRELGTGHLAAWAASLPEAVRARLYLKFPELVLVLPSDDERAVEIVRRAAV